MMIRSYREARDHGCAYLLKQQRSDGGFGPSARGLADYYKVPLAYLVCGASAEANRLFNWIRKHGMTSNGDLGPRLPETLGYYYLYYNTWITIGAQRQGHFDIARRAMDFISGFWDSESGGFYSSATERGTLVMQDLWVTSGGGQAALYTGRMDIAIGVGRWMKRLMSLQPNYPPQLFSVYSRAGGLHTTFDSSDYVRYVLNANATRDEYFFNPGIAAGFLANLYKATGQPDWLNLAKEYMQIAEIASDFLYHTLRAGKVGWAAAILLTLTGETRYRDIAIRVGDNLLSSQMSAGNWTLGGMSSNDATAEMVIWLDEIHQAVAG
jgi:hypothetical protein